MDTILSLDTSTKVCSVAIHNNGELIGQQSYHLQKSHSNLLPVIIRQLAENCEMELRHLKAIALSAGPGSYTGLRIGTATAKGLAFSLNLPLIAIDSLDTMVEQVRGVVPDEAVLFPMIDARRMEVYTKAVVAGGDVLWETQPLIVEEDSFKEFESSQMFFFGNGADKLKEMFSESSIRFVDDIHPCAAAMGKLAFEKFQNEEFEDLAYFEPDYLKEFRTNVPSQKFKV